MSAISSQPTVYLTPTNNKKRTPRYFGTFSSPHTPKAPRLDDPTLSMFTPPSQLKQTKKPAHELRQLTLDGGNTVHLTGGTLRPLNRHIFVHNDIVVPDTDGSDSDEGIFITASSTTGNDGGPPFSFPSLPPNEEDYIRIHVRSLCFDDTGVEYYLSVTEKFGRVYDDYAHRLDYTSDRIRLFWASLELGREQTPQGIGMYDEAFVRVYGRDPEMNLDTHFKVFIIIQEARDEPTEMCFRVTKTVHMDRVYREWADYIDANHSNVVLIRRGKIKPRVGFLFDSGICNGDRLFSILLEI